jgi:hypothetical protein
VGEREPCPGHLSGPGPPRQLLDRYDDGEQPDVRRRSTGKDILWWFVLVLFIGITVALI